MKEDNFIDWELIERSFNDTLGSAEEEKLKKWLAQSEKHRVFYNSAIQGGYTDPLYGIGADKLNSIKRDFLTKIKKRDVVRQNRGKYIKVAAAVVIPLFISLSVLFFNSPLRRERQSPQFDFKPGTSKAILVLESGSTINLSNDSTLIKDGVTKIVNHNRQLVYESNHNKVSESYKEEVIVKNKLLVPRGGEYVIVLSDGTRVWLNSDSQLEYPVKFIGETREVTLTGEGYFEVTKNSKVPFIVKSEDFSVRVVGTSFNINSYKDMNRSDITVETGAVDVIRPSGKVTRVNKYQQLIVNRLTNEQIVQTVDAGVAMSWKNGFFYFDKEPLDNIIKKISRWYDVNTVITSDSLSKMRFFGEVIKYGNASEVLEMLSLTGEIKYEILNDKIIISPKSPK